MYEYIVPILVAVIGLSGTMIGLYVGYRKWNLEKQLERSTPYRTERQKAYKELWDRVEQLNVDGRLQPIPMDVFSDRLTELNANILRSGLYIDDTDQTLINEYVRAAREFHTAVRESENIDAQLALGDTAQIPQHIVAAEHRIRETSKQALALREKVVTRIRSVLMERE